MAYLYLEPMIYVPYEISLRKRNAIVLKEFYIEGGELLPVTGFKCKRMPNKNYIYLKFKEPNYVDVSQIEGTGKAITLFIQFEVKHDEKTVSVQHRHHIGVSKPSNNSRLRHFNIKNACPTMYGLEGKRILEDSGLPSGLSQYREVIQFGLDEANNEGRKWVLETFDLLYPIEQIPNAPRLEQA